MVVVVLLVVLVVVVDVVIFLLLMVLTLVVVLILSFAFKTNQKYEVLETMCSLEVFRSSSFHPGPPTSEQPRTLKSTSGPPTRTRGTSQFALPQASASNNGHMVTSRVSTTAVVSTLNSMTFLPYVCQRPKSFLHE